MCAARARIGLGLCFAFVLLCGVSLAEDWPQLKYDSRHSGNVPDRDVAGNLGLVGAVPLTEAIFTAPVVKDGRVYVVDGAGVVFCIDASTVGANNHSPGTLEVRDRGRQGQLQQHVVLCSGGSFPPRRDHGREILRAGLRQRHRGQGNPVRRAHPGCSCGCGGARVLRDPK